MNEEINFALIKLKNAFFSLSEGVEKAVDELDKDGVIQRFEFTIELLWKALRIILKYENIEVNSPRDSFKEGFRLGIINDEKTFLSMLEDRNLTSHIYDQDTSETIFKRIKEKYIPVLENILIKLQERMD